MNIFINECLLYALSAKEQSKTKIFFDLLNDILNKTDVSNKLNDIKPIN